MVLGGHGDGAEEEASEGGVFVEDGAPLGVDVKDVESGWVFGVGGVLGELGFEAAKECAEDRAFEGVEEEGEDGSGGQGEGDGVLLEELGWQGVGRWGRCRGWSGSE